MVQRLGLAVAALPDTPLLLLDEPTAALDPEGLSAFYALVEGRRREGRTILFTSHHLGDVERLADRFAVLVEGRLVALLSAASSRTGSPTAASSASASTARPGRSSRRSAPPAPAPARGGGARPPRPRVRPPGLPRGRPRDRRDGPRPLFRRGTPRRPLHRARGRSAMRSALRAAAVLPFVLLAACGGGTDGPAPLDTKNDACAWCRMSVSDLRFAAQLTAPGPRAEALRRRRLPARLAEGARGRPPRGPRGSPTTGRRSG